MRKLIPIILVLALLLCACGDAPAAVPVETSAPDKAAPSAYELAEYIILATGRGMDSVVFVNSSYAAESLAGYIEGYYGLASEALSDGAIFRSAAADDAFEISVFKLTEQADLSSVFNELEEYRHGRQGDFFGYNPQQADMVDNAIISISSNEEWAAVLICEEPEKAEEAFWARLELKLPEEEPDHLSTGTDLDDAESFYLENFGELPDYWYPYIDPNIDDMSLWDSSELVSAVKAGSDEGLDAYGRKLYRKVNEVIKKEIRSGMTELEKERAIYEWLTENCEYDYRHYEVPNNAPRESYEPYGAIVECTAVCLGFAEAFRLFMDILDIECITVVGAAFDSREDHAWNMVRLDGEWYCCDPTWDAGVKSEWFGYFNVSSDYMAMTSHQWDYEAYPIAEAEGDGSWDEVLWVPVE